MAILTNSGRVAMAKAIAELKIFMCWGEGNPAWGENPPNEPVTATDLLNAVGFHTVTAVQFCTPKADGEIVIPSGRFAVSPEPTNHLYLRFIYDFEDARGKVIREFGVFTGTRVKDGLAAGKLYFLPGEIESTGDLLLLEYRKPLYREAGVRETFEFVVTF